MSPFFLEAINKMVFAGVVFALFILISSSVALGAPWLTSLLTATGLLSLLTLPAIPLARANRMPVLSQVIIFAFSAWVCGVLSVDFDWIPILTLLVALSLCVPLALAAYALDTKFSAGVVAATTLGVLFLLWAIGMAVAPNPSSILRNIPVMESFGIEFRSDAQFLPLIWVLVIVAAWLISNIFDSSVGRAIVISDINPAVARSFGINRFAHTRGFHLIAAFCAAVVGWLFAHWSRELGVTLISPQFVLSVALCIGSGMFLGPWGAVLAAGVLNIMGVTGLVKTTLSSNLVVQGIIAVLAVGFLVALWRFFPLINTQFRKFRRRFDPHNVDMGAIDERSGMKGQGAPPPGTELLSLDKVSLKRANGEAFALQDFDFDIQSGECIGIFATDPFAHAGLLGIMSGRITPTSGEVWVWAESAQRIAAHDWVRHGIARTHQPSQLIDDFHVIDNVTAGATARLDVGVLPSLFRFNAGADRTLRSEGMFHLARVWMREEAAEMPSALTESRKQLVELARALTADPALLVLDHPSKTLDGEDRVTYLQLVSELLDSGLAVVLIDSDIAFVRSCATRVMVVDKGIKCADGPTERVLADTAIRAKLSGL